MTSGISTLTGSARGIEPVIDRSVLGEWLGDDDAGINALLLVFRDSIRDEHDRLKHVLAAGDLSEFGKTAHRLRGAALSMGARGLADVAGHLHDMAQAADTRACLAGMARLDIQVGLMVGEIPEPPEPVTTPSH